MKAIIEEADRLMESYSKYVDIYGEKLDYDTESYQVECAIIDVSNTIEVLDSIPLTHGGIDLKRKFHNHVKQELESRLNK